MAIGKRVKEGGCYYKGTILPVSSASGTYVTFLSLTGTGGCAVNSLSIVPANAGPGDYVNVEHVQGTAGSVVIATLAENLYNMGGGIPINLDFIAMEKVLSGNSIKVSYINTASVAMNVFLILERGR